jgi:hypothetical protein
MYMILHAVKGSESINLEELTPSSNSTFLKQANNYGIGPLSFEKVQALDEKNNQVGSIHFEVLYKKKKNKKKTNNNFEENDTYVLGLIEDKGFKERIQEAKARAACEGFPILRSALASNTVNRIRFAALSIFDEDYPNTKKKDLIKKLESLVLDKLDQDELFKEAANQVGDLAVVIEAQECLEVNDYILLKVNGKNNFGEWRVIENQTFSGWLLKSRKLKYIEEIESKNVRWGNLNEKLVVSTNN